MRPLLLVVVLVGIAVPVFAEEAVSGRTMFAVDSDEWSASESLERISGDIDRGFSSPDDSYQSDSHYKPGIFSRERAAQASD